MKHAIGVLRYVAFFGLLLLASAGTLAWPRAWILLGVLLIVHGVGTWSILRVNRALLDDRAKLKGSVRSSSVASGSRLASRSRFGAIRHLRTKSCSRPLCSRSRC